MKPLSDKRYNAELLRLQTELVTLQEWAIATKQRIVVLFEGRDAAGKGTVIKQIAYHMNPRKCKIVALEAPTEKEKTQWYFQRYIQHLPSAGEIVLFDRSWYNRAGVERVMGFCTDAQYDMFFKQINAFEKMLIEDGIIVIKYWLSVTDEEQEARFKERKANPVKKWKLSPMDLESRKLWESYTAAKEFMFDHSQDFVRWNVVHSVDKRKAILNCISHLLSQFNYFPVKSAVPALPRRKRSRTYKRKQIPLEMIVPEVF